MTCEPHAHELANRRHNAQLITRSAPPDGEKHRRPANLAFHRLQLMIASAAKHVTRRYGIDAFDGVDIMVRRKRNRRPKVPASQDTADSPYSRRIPGERTRWLT